MVDWGARSAAIVLLPSSQATPYLCLAQGADGPKRVPRPKRAAWLKAYFMGGDEGWASG